MGGGGGGGGSKQLQQQQRDRESAVKTALQFNQVWRCVYQGSQFLCVCCNIIYLNETIKSGLQEFMQK